MKVHLRGSSFSATVITDLGDAYWVIQDDGVYHVWYKFECLPWLTDKEG